MVNNSDTGCRDTSVEKRWTNIVARLGRHRKEIVIQTKTQTCCTRSELHDSLLGVQSVQLLWTSRYW